MTNYVYDKGTIFVAPGGGAAPTPLPPGVDGQALIYDSSEELGVRPGAGGTGDVTGPGSSTTGHLASFGSVDGDLLADSGVVAATVAVGPGSSTAHHLAAFASTDGLTLEDAGIVAANVVVNASTSTDNAIARFDSTTGKIIQNSPVTIADTTGTMTWPAGGGSVLTTGGAAARKGTFTLTTGSSGDIATTSVLTGSVIAITITALGTVTAPKPMYVTITNGTKFVITSSDGTDSSSGTWAIVA